MVGTHGAFFLRGSLCNIRGIHRGYGLEVGPPVLLVERMTPCAFFQIEGVVSPRNKSTTFSFFVRFLSAKKYRKRAVRPRKG